MRLVIQRVTEARVDVARETVGSIGLGLLVLVGFGQGDDQALPESKAWKGLLDKLVNLRIFPDEEGKLNKSLKDIQGDALAVSQFTLYADCRKGRRPSFVNAAPPDTAHHLYHRFCTDLAAKVPGKTATGEFGAEMRVSFTNWGPVTIVLDSDDFGN